MDKKARLGTSEGLVAFAVMKGNKGQNSGANPVGNNGLVKRKVQPIYLPMEKRVRLSTFGRRPENTMAFGGADLKEKEGLVSDVMRVRNYERRALYAAGGNNASGENTKITRISTIGCSKNAQIVCPGSSNEDSEINADRKRVKDTLKKFEEILKTTEQKSRRKTWGFYAAVAKTLQMQDGHVNFGKRVGHIPGVNAGDIFSKRAQLVVLGLHGHHQRGIDYIKTVDNALLATSIVVTGAYENSFSSPNELTYSGEGENPKVSKNKHPKDQKLKFGNLALQNSMKAKCPVRVIRQIELQKTSNKKDSTYCYFYDGLFAVEHASQRRGRFGKLVYEFELKRIVTQLASEEKTGLIHKKYDTAKTRTTSYRLTRTKGILCSDLSRGMEKVPIPVVNTIDTEKPPVFNYITEMIYPELNRSSFTVGCSCTHGCITATECHCAIKNRRKLIYSSSGCNMTEKPIIYECGWFCKCSSSCVNRVSQQGIQVQLEVFRKPSQWRWAVRSRSFIPAGRFVCEYIGEIFRASKVKASRACTKYMFDINTGDFIIDSKHFGNVGRFINHSSFPNLSVKCVLYDHGDKRMPHVMFFAMKNIPPLHELTIDYR